MQEIQIKKFAAQYFLPSNALAERQRLDQVMKLVLGEMLERAMSDANLPEDGELCLSRICVPISLHLVMTDASLAAEWSRKLTEEILSAMRDRRAVFYRSRRQALMDVVLSVARGDLSRAWAWRQLGFWNVSDAASETEVIVELVKAVSSDPVAVIPALNSLAEAGCLDRITRRLNARHWVALATSALHEAGAAGVIKEATAGNHSSRALRDSLLVIAGSRLLPSIIASQSLAGESLEACRLVAALAVLETEPARLRSNSAGAMVDLIAGAIRSAVTKLTPPLLEAPEGQGADRKATGETTDRDEEPDAPDGATAAERAAGALRTAGAMGASEATGSTGTFGPTAVESDIEQAAWRADEEAREVLMVIDRQRRASTRFGGLLFLLGLIDELELVDEILAHPALGVRPFRWVMHRLALTLVGTEEQDPAALAFAGLPPETELPLDREPPHETETCEIDSLATRIVEQLGVLTGWQGDRVKLVEFVCRRRAEIVADPGWIDVRLSLDEVATEIRRAGLDLDPGYVSWLGVVVRFVYE